MKLSKMKLRIINLIQRQTAVEGTAQNRETNIQKTENPAVIPHNQAKTSSRDTYMFVSQMNKPIGSSYPDGDVLHIDTLFKAARSAV